MPTSNVTRVRSEGFSKISAMNLPCSVEAYRIGRALMSAERWSNSRVCAGLHSAPVRRSFDKEMGATRVVVVIFSPCRGMGDARRFRGLAGIRCAGLLRGSRENEFEEPEKFAHLHAVDDERGEQTQRGIVSAIDQQAVLHGFRYKGRTFDGEFDSDHQPFSANFADEVKLGGELRETLTKLSAARANVLEEFFALDGFEEFERGGASERTAAKCCPVHARRNARSNRLRRKNRTERQTRRERLGDQSDVRLG